MNEYIAIVCRSTERREAFANRLAQKYDRNSFRLFASISQMENWNRVFSEIFIENLPASSHSRDTLWSALRSGVGYSNGVHSFVWYDQCIQEEREWEDIYDTVYRSILS